MLRQCKTVITFKSPVLGKDLQDAELFNSDKHWVIAEVLVYDTRIAKFVNYDNKIVAEWPTTSIKSISIPSLDPESPVILAQKSRDYQAQVKAQRPGAWSKWTPSQDDQVRRMVEEGLNYDEIADALQRTPRAIYERLLKLGLSPDSHPVLGNRPEKRHLEMVSWDGNAPIEDELITICLGCGIRIHVRPCLCWTRNDTSYLTTWRDRNHEYTIFGARIYKEE